MPQHDSTTGQRVMHHPAVANNGFPAQTQMVLPSLSRLFPFLFLVLQHEDPVCPGWTLGGRHRQVPLMLLTATWNKRKLGAYQLEHEVAPLFPHVTLAILVGSQPPRHNSFGCCTSWLVFRFPSTARLQVQTEQARHAMPHLRLSTQLVM